MKQEAESTDEVLLVESGMAVADSSERDEDVDFPQDPELLDKLPTLRSVSQSEMRTLQV